MPSAKGVKRAADTDAGGLRAKICLEPATKAKCGLVKAALAAAEGLPSEAAQMLDIVIPLSLGQRRDQRHAYQVRVVDAFADMLHGLEAGLKGDREAAEKDVQDAEAAKVKSGADVAEAVDMVTANDGASQERKTALADEAAAFRDMRNALRHAQAKQTQCETDLATAAARLAESRAAVGDWLGPLKGGGGEPLPEAEACALRAKLLGFLSSKEIDLDESLMTALPAALEKASDARGPFDLLAVQELESVMSARVATIVHELAAGEPTKAQHAEAVGAAQAACDNVAGKLRDSAAAFRVAQTEHQESEASLASTQKTSRDMGAELRRVTRVLERTSGKLEKFQCGALQAFGELRDSCGEEGTSAAPVADADVAAEAASTDMADAETPAPPLAEVETEEAVTADAAVGDS